MPHFARHTLPLPLIALLAACAAPQGEFPSLAIREAERISGSAEPARPDPAPRPSLQVADSANAEDWLSSAKAAHADFLAALPAARSRIAAGRGANAGSDRWAEAQIALAGLQTARSRVNVAVTELDRLYVAALTEGLLPGAIEGARSESLSLLAEEDGQIAALSAGLN